MRHTHRRWLRLLASGFSLCLLAIMFPLSSTAAINGYGPLPNAAQLAYHQESLAAFCHFGMNTFTNRQWGTGKESPSQFALVSLQADAYVKALKDAGFGRLIITAKHHDGFCIWPSAYTTHDVTSSPYPGDPLAEFSAACTKYDMDMGLYLSPWDRHEPSYGYGPGGSPGNDKNGDYNAYFLHQIEEIVSNPKYGNNGRFVEWWLDGAKGEGEEAQEYDTSAWVAKIRKYEPDCQVFGYGDIAWIGNEDGIAPEECWSAKGNRWQVQECDTPMSKPKNGTKQWFHNTGDTPLSMEELTNIYFSSIGHGGTLLLNVPMDASGNLPAAFAARLKEFSAAIRTTFSEDMALGRPASASFQWDSSHKAACAVDGDENTYWAPASGQTTGTVTVELDGPCYFDAVSLQEYIPLGQRVSGFSIDYRLGEGSWKNFGSGTTIGPKKIVRGTMAQADTVRLTITAAKATPLINTFSIHSLASAFLSDLTPVKQAKTALEKAVSSTTAVYNNRSRYVDGTARQNFIRDYEQAKRESSEPDAPAAALNLAQRLTDAPDTLCLTATRNQLGSVIKNLRAEDPGQYTEASLEATKKVLAAAEACYQNTSSSEKEVSNATAALKKAITGLVKRPPEESSVSSSSTPTWDLPKPATPEKEPTASGSQPAERPDSSASSPISPSISSPNASSDMPSDISSVEELPTPSQTIFRYEKSGQPWWLGLIVGGAVLLVGGGVITLLLILYYKKGGKHKPE